MSITDAKKLCEVLNDLNLHESEAYDLVALLSAKFDHLWWRFTHEGYFDVRERE